MSIGPKQRIRIGDLIIRSDDETVGFGICFQEDDEYSSVYWFDSDPFPVSRWDLFNQNYVATRTNGSWTVVRPNETE